MDAQRDTKPFVSPIITATGAIQRSLHGRSASQPAPALPSEHGGGARVLAGGLRPQAQPQPHQAACVLNRAASELSSGGVGGRASGADEALEEGTSASRRPCVAPRLSRKFWSAGDYDAAATGSVPQPPSMSPCWSFFVRVLLILCSMPLCSMLTTLLRCRCAESNVHPPWISPL